MSRALTAAVETRLRSDELADCVYYDKPIPTTTTRYLRIRTNGGVRTTERLAAPLGPKTQTFWLTGVGTSPKQAAWVLEQATDLLLNWIPDVPGWRCRRLEHAASQPVDVDPDVDGRYVGVDQWDLFSEPRPA